MHQFVNVDLSAAMLDQARLSGAGAPPTPPPGAPSPFGLADADLGRTWLTGAGFTDVEHRAVKAKFNFGANADDAFSFVCRTSGPVACSAPSLNNHHPEGEGHVRVRADHALPHR